MFSGCDRLAKSVEGFSRECFCFSVKWYMQSLTVLFTFIVVF